MSGLVRSLLCAALLLAPAPARAFCQATTCDPTDAKQHCARDKELCFVSGAPLHWASSCLTISVQADGAPKSGIDYETAEASVRRAFEAWTNADCAGGKPSLRVEISEPVRCDTSEYSSDRGNANIVTFRENDWPYVGAEDALGLTRVRFDLDDLNGELWDADIEVNAVTEPLSVDHPSANEVDLDSLLTHEAGHVLGLGHTIVNGATMLSGYETGSEALRTLEPDDVEGMCAIYPPNREASSSSCEPRHGFSELCATEQPAQPNQPDEPNLPDDDSSPGESKGCSLAGNRAVSGSSFWLLAALGAVAARRRASSPKRHQLVPCGRLDVQR